MLRESFVDRVFLSVVFEELAVGGLTPAGIIVRVRQNDDTRHSALGKMSGNVAGIRETGVSVKLGGEFDGMHGWRLVLLRVRSTKAIQARALGMEVAGISMLTNWAAGLRPQTLHHAEVVEVGKTASLYLARLLKAAV